MDSLKKKIHHLLVVTSLITVVDLFYVLIFGKKLPLAWMDEAVDRVVLKLRDGQTGAAYGPRIYGEEQAIATVTTPEIFCYAYRQARVSVSSSSVIENEQRVYIERVNLQDQTVCNYAGGHIFKHNLDSARVTRIGKCAHIPNGIALFGNGTGNYYHWLIEIAPQLEFLDALPDEYRDYPLLVSEDARTIESFRYTMQLLCQSRQIIYLEKNCPYLVDHLVWITTPSNLPFNLRKNSKFLTEYTILDKRSLDYVRNHVLADVAASAESTRYPARIIFCRKNERRNYNQAEVVACLEKHGFVQVFMEDLPFVEQVRTVYNAQIIVGPTGAAWTNLLFCRPGTRALCWMAEEVGNFSAFSTLAGLYDIDLYYLTYQSGVKRVSDLYFKDYAIDVQAIEKIVQELMKNSADFSDGNARPDLRMRDRMTTI